MKSFLRVLTLLVFAAVSSIGCMPVGFAQSGEAVRQPLPQPSERNMANTEPHFLQDDDPLAAAILAAAKQACAEVARWHAGNPFYPTRDDLTGLVLIKLISVPQLQNIWNDPDPETGGPTGLLRFARTVAKRAAIDEKRRNEVRAPEILAARMDEPIYEDGERTGTLADTISDADCTYQAFQFDDLRSELTEQEYTVLQTSVVNGATQQELAEEIGTSDSAISRTYIRAKEKAQKWIRWLKDRTDKQVRANIYPTFTRRPCLRPNGIAPETLARWNDALTDSKSTRIVPFHDQASEWHPPITKQAYVRAKRDCWNPACQSGLAIGLDNLVLPAARTNEAVRFLPAYTGQDNRLCAGCETAEQRANNLQTVSGGTVHQIGCAEPAAKVISFVEQSEMQTVPNVTHVPFISALALNGSAERNENMQAKRLDYKEGAEIIKTYSIPRSTVARLAGLHLPDLSAWLGGKIDISEEKRERVSQWIADVAKMIQAMATLGIKVDLNDVENVRYLVQKINDAEAQLDLFDMPGLPTDLSSDLRAVSERAAAN